MARMEAPARPTMIFDVVGKSFQVSLFSTECKPYVVEPSRSEDSVADDNNFDPESFNGQRNSRRHQGKPDRRKISDGDLTSVALER
ncbi:hypothetical protein O9X98_06365 [Agrobacterium salinitolerans]|nr:hypothetical protein [Agrobacterium salinitolerans]